MKPKDPVIKPKNLGEHQQLNKNNDETAQRIEPEIEFLKPLDPQSKMRRQFDSNDQHEIDIQFQKQQTKFPESQNNYEETQNQQLEVKDDLMEPSKQIKPQNEFESEPSSLVEPICQQTKVYNLNDQVDMSVDENEEVQTKDVLQDEQENYTSDKELEDNDICMDKTKLEDDQVSIDSTKDDDFGNKSYHESSFSGE